MIIIHRFVSSFHHLLVNVASFSGTVCGEVKSIKIEDDSHKRAHTNTRARTSSSPSIFSAFDSEPPKVSPTSNVSLPNQQQKVTSVFNMSPSMPSASSIPGTSTTNAQLRHKTSQNFGAIRYAIMSRYSNSILHNNVI